jgi:uncharacterized protein YqeY
MASLLERLNADLKDAMRAADTVRRDEIRSLLAQIKSEQQVKLTRALGERGLLLGLDTAEDGGQVLSPEQEAEIATVRASSGLTEDEVQAVLIQRVVQHRQSIDAFKKGNRVDLLQVEEAQLAIDAAYLPQLDEAAIEAAIQAAIAESGATSLREQGKAMSLLSARLRGKADMKAVAARVQALLGARG